MKMDEMNKIKKELQNLSVREMFELSEALIVEFKLRRKVIDSNTINSKVKIK